MASSQVDRPVLFTLTVQEDESAQSVLEQFGKRVANVQDEINKSALAVAKQRTDESVAIFEKAEKEKTAALQRALREREGMAKRLGSASAAAPSSPGSTSSAAPSKAADEAGAAAKKATAEMRALDREADKVRRSIRTEGEERSQQLTRLRRLYEEGKISLTEYGRATQQVHEKAAAAADKQRAAQERVVAQQQRAAASQQRAIDSSMRQYDSAIEQSRSYGMAGKAAFSEVGEGALRAGRGIAMLGLVGKDSTEQILRGLIKIQAAYDVFKGSFEVWRKMREGMEAYRKATLAAAAAEEALAAARAKSAAAGVPAPTAAAGRGAAGAGSAGVGAGGAAAGAPLAAWGAAAVGVAAAAVSAALTGREAMKHGIGGGAAEGSLVDKVGSSRWNPFAQMIGRGLGPGGVRMGKDEFAAEDAAKERTAQMEAERASYEALTKAANESLQARFEAARQIAALDEAAAERAVATAQRRESVVAKAQDRAAEDAARTANERARRQFEREKAAGGMSAAEQERRGMELAERERRAAEVAQNRQAIRPLESQQGEAIARQERAGRSVAGLTGQRERAEAQWMAARESRDAGAVDEALASMAAIDQSLAQSIEKQAAATQSRLEAERAIGAERLRAADMAIKRTEDEITMRKAMIEREQDAYRSAEERFGMLSAKEQRQLVALKRRDLAGEDLSIAERQKLAQYGTREEQESLSRAAKESARRGGFGQWFGQEEPERWRREREEVEGIEVRLKDQRDFKVTVEQDTDRIVDRLSEVVARELARRDEILRREFGQRLEQVETNAARNAGVKAAVQGTGR